MTSLNKLYFFVICLVSTLFISCSSVRVNEENTLTRNSNIIANKVNFDAWDYHKVVDGKSIVVHLHKNSFLKGSFDGSSYYYITFQLPSEAKEGDIFSLQTISKDRKVKKVGEYTSIAEMKDLEVTGFRFGNPKMGYMKDIEQAEVKIVSISNSKALIHLKLKAKLKPTFSFDIDQEFKLKLKKPSQR